MQTIKNYEEALSKQLDILLVNEPDTSRNGDKYLDWKNALSEVREQIDALHQDPGWDNVHKSSQAECTTTLDKTVEKTLEKTLKKTLKKCTDTKSATPRHQREHEVAVKAVEEQRKRVQEAQAHQDQVRAQSQERFLKFLHGFAGVAAS